MKLPEPQAWLMVYPGGRSQLRYAKGSAATFLKDAADLKSYSLYTESQMLQAIKDAYEEAAKVCDSLIHYGEVSGILCAKAIRNLKEQVE